MQSICFVTKAQYTTHHCDLYALVCWPSLHIHRQTHWLQVITTIDKRQYRAAVFIDLAKACDSGTKAVLGKALPYLSSLVTIATPTCSTHSSRYMSLVIPQSQQPLWPSFLPVHCCQWLEWIAKITEAGDISPSITLSISCQSSLRITAPVHSPSVNSPPNYLHIDHLC